MIYQSRHTEEKHLRNLSEPAPLSLVRRRCACGSVITAVQDKRQGCCDVCVKVALL